MRKVTITLLVRLFPLLARENEEEKCMHFLHSRIKLKQGNLCAGKQKNLLLYFLNVNSTF